MSRATRFGRLVVSVPTNPRMAMLPQASLVPDVLPTDRVLENGRARPEIRAEWRRIPSVRNAVTVLGAYAEWMSILSVAVIVDHTVGWVVAGLLMVRIMGLLGVLAHEAVHSVLFSNSRLNRWGGRWLLAYPTLLSFDWYKREHLRHHREELGPFDIDLRVYGACPMDPSSFRRKLLRDLFLLSGWKVLRSNLRGFFGQNAEARRMVLVQAVMLAVATIAGRPELYLFLWLLPWMTLWRVVTRLRLIAEHGGLVPSKDRRLTTHHVKQGFLPRFWMVPYNLGWHLAHHVDMAIPFRNLPALHRELVAAGWIPPGFEHSSYISLWQLAASGAPDAVNTEALSMATDIRGGARAV